MLPEEDEVVEPDEEVVDPLDEAPEDEVVEPEDEVVEPEEEAPEDEVVEPDDEVVEPEEEAPEDEVVEPDELGEQTLLKHTNPDEQSGSVQQLPVTQELLQTI